MRLKVLMIEDDQAFAEMYQSALGTFGIEICCAANGRDGLRLARSKHPQAILLDLALPDKHGFEVLKELKRHDKTKDIPVAILTVFDDENLKKLALQLGAKCYLIKSEHEPKEVAEKLIGCFCGEDDCSSREGPAD
ncbi:hypothetical protein AMJ57_04715 [Parcubacteria bacterium SG8_24]|nr:MAG: hypothetical protein AMJ57_04715 [Parcubacteria bacterium SG8_24]